MGLNIAARMGGIKGWFGASGMGTKLGLAAGYVGTGLAANAYISHVADMKRAYYGESRYNSYYGQGAETLGAIPAGLGLLWGGLALIGRDPITRAKGSYKYYINDGGGMSGRKKLRSSSVPESEKQRIKHTPVFGIPQIAQVIGLAGGGMLSSPHLFNVGAGLVGGAAAIQAGRLGVTAYKKAGIGGGAGFAGTVGAGLAGSAIGYGVTNRRPHPAAEGNITSFNETNVVERMNWSTAGLVQALHKNNRRVGT